MKLFLRITKADAKKREVHGRAVQEVADNSGEIFDYESSKPYFEEWSSRFEKQTDGKSLGNVRAMHGNVAAGKLTGIDFNDAEKAVDVVAKVVDDMEWQKVEDGIYTGFSIGGSYVKRWKDGTLTRYTAKPIEISLVDAPCVPTATFQLIKADGTQLDKEFRMNPKQPAQEAAKSQEAAVDGLAEILNKGELTAEEVLAAARDALAKKGAAAKPADEPAAKPADAPASRPVAKGDDPRHSHTITEAGGTGQPAAKKADDPAPAAAAPAPVDAAATETAAKADTPAPAEPSAEEVAAHNAAVEKVARELAKAAGKHEATWEAFIPEAVRELEKRKVSDKERGKLADEGKAMPDGSYPIANREDLKNAIQAYGRAKDKEKVKAHIIARAKALKATDELPADWEGSTKDKGDAKDSKKADEPAGLKKGLYDVAQLAQVLSVLAGCAAGAESEAQWEGDNSPVPAKLRAVVSQLGDVLKDMTGEEVDELVASLGGTAQAAAAVLAMAERVTLAKAGARHSAQDKEHLQNAHDSLVKLGAVCKADGDGDQMGDDRGNAGVEATPQKADAGSMLKTAVAGLAKVRELSELLEKANGTIEELAKRVKSLEDQPAPAKGALKTITKAQDGAGGAEQPEVIKSTPGQHNPEAAKALLVEQIRKSHGIA